MKRFSFTLFTLCVFAALSLLGPLSTVRAAFTTTGNVEPSAPATWTSSTSGYVGKNSNGTLTVNAGSDLSSYEAFIGYGDRRAATGDVTITGSGSTWSNATDIYVGYSYYGSASGTLTVSNGAVNNIGWRLIIGSADDSSNGVVTVTGGGSTLTATNGLYIGSDGGGSGTLNIADGATVVSSNGPTRVAATSGTIQFGTGGGTLTTGSLGASPSQLIGTGIINTGGLVSDLDLVLDSTASLNQAFTFNKQGQNITVNLNMIDGVANGDLGAGWQDKGSLIIRDGLAIQCQSGFIGQSTGSTGTVTVSGTGTKWTMSSIWGLDVGNSGNGTLLITNGGSVSNNNGNIGDRASSTGKVTVDGSGSTWTNSTGLTIGDLGNGTLTITGGASVSSTNGTIGFGYNSTGVVTVAGANSKWTIEGYTGELLVGNHGSGTVSITNGGSVTAARVSIYESLLAIDVGNSSLLNVGNGTGTIINYGTVRIIAGAGAAAATFTPILAGTWYGTNNQAIGGTWNADSHVFTASAVETGTSGTAVNLNGKQRVLVNDSGTGKTGW